MPTQFQGNQRSGLDVHETLRLIAHAKLHHQPFAVGAHVVQIAQAQCELTVIACCVLFLGSSFLDIHHVVRHDKLRSCPATTPDMVTVETKDREDSEEREQLR